MIKQEILNLDPNEIVVDEIKRHPIGLLWVYLTGGFIFCVMLLVAFVIAKNQNSLGFNIKNSEIIIATFASALSILVVIATGISAVIYKANELIVTNESIILIYQASLFHRKISQLNLDKIEDVTTQQKGFFPSIFGYGTLTIETAGEMSNFIFPYAPNPNLAAKTIIEAHDQYKMNSENAHNTSRN